MTVAGTPWQLECENLEQKCGYLLTSGIWSDCIFMVGSETNQEVIQAHKLVLAMASPVFEAMFYGGLSDRNDAVISIPDVQPEAFKALLQYIYTSNIKIGSLDLAWDVLYGAKKYMLPHVAQECKRYISSVLGPVNACRAYECAYLFDEKVLMDKCLKIISTNTKEVLNDSSFMDVELKTVIKVLSLDHLNVDRELDLFQAVARYAEAKQRRQLQISPAVEGAPAPEELSDNDKVLPCVESSSHTNPAPELETKPPTEVVTSDTIAHKENLKEEEPSIREAIQKIRFLSMTAQEFAEGPARSDLLTEAETLAVILNITTTDSPVPMPTGFSESRERRQPRNDSTKHCFKVASLDPTISSLKSENSPSIEAGARAAGDILSGTADDIQQALDKGILDALIPALQNSYKSTLHAVLAITTFCARGSSAQLRVLAEGDALETYCKQLNDGGSTCYGILLGITNLLGRIDHSAQPALLLKLRKIGLPQLLLTVQQGENIENRKKAIEVLEAYFLHDK